MKYHFTPFIPTRMAKIEKQKKKQTRAGGMAQVPSKRKL
jgi:hypothetical protein